jgi:two-component system, cell cycle sensor histidine kinase and response regulator CckA
MKDEEKTKQELISELKILRKKYTKLKQSHEKKQTSKEISGTETILVVDDNTSTRTAIVKMLDRCGYNSFEANSSKSAIEIVKADGKIISLVLSDVVMPEINGPEMVEKLLKIQPDIKIVFMSGYDEDEIVHSDVFNIQQSHTTFIKKPFSFEEIGRIIREQIDNKR